MLEARGFLCYIKTIKSLEQRSLIMTTEKYSGKDFLSAIEAQDGDGKNRKETIFNALFNACGTEFSDKDFPERSSNDEIAKLRIKLEAPKRTLFIAGYERKKMQLEANGHLDDVEPMLIKPKTEDYMVVAMGAYLKAGGKIGDFRKDMEIYKNKYTFEKTQQAAHAMSLQASREGITA